MKAGSRAMLTDAELAELRRLATTVPAHAVQHDPDAIVALVDEVREHRRAARQSRPTKGETPR